MSWPKLQNPETYLRFVNWVGWPLIVAYSVSMFFVPIFHLEGDWDRIQNVWDRWQGLNVGMLAFISSLLVFNISRYQSEEARKRQFRAAKSFLPEALSELTGYCKSSMAAFGMAHKRASDPQDQCNTPLDVDEPELPEGYRKVFSDCIAVAEPHVAERLSYILMRLQIHHARMGSLFEAFTDENTVVSKQNIISYLYCIGEIQTLINKTFDFARGLNEFDDTALVWEDYRNAFSNGDLWVDDYEDLQGFVERAIARGSR